MRPFQSSSPAPLALLVVTLQCGKPIDAALNPFQLVSHILDRELEAY